MKTQTADVVADVRERLIGLGGEIAQDLGVSRLAGQILVHLYLQDGPVSMECIEQELQLSKAAVSVAARQLEQLGLLKKVHKVGDRKAYYRTADDLAEVLRNGFVQQVRRKADEASRVLSECVEQLRGLEGEDDTTEFLTKRVSRARQLSDRANRVINSRILRYFAD